MAHILLIDDQQSVLTSLSILLKRHGHQVACGANAAEARRFLADIPFDLVVTDLRMGQPYEGMEVLETSLNLQPSVPVIIMTGYATIENAVEAIKRGAFDYLTKGFSNQEFLQKVDRALWQDKLISPPEETVPPDRPEGFEHIIGRSPQIIAILKLVDKVAASDSSVLIEGESGTGKELIAKAIHRKSPRSRRPFVAINCAAFPDTLLESELYGYVRGSFTGAFKDKIGLFVAADKGTLFLDEVSEMSSTMQIKLLRALQERVVRPLGSTASQAVDVRIISATNRDLLTEVAEGNFREDLYFRLCVVPIRIPPLRERQEDIPALVDTFLRHFGAKYQKHPLQLERSALELIMGQPWKGNTRELENFLERLTLLQETFQVRAADLAPYFTAHPGGDVPESPSLAGQERDHILRVLDQAGWNQSEAARRLGIGRTTLWRKMKTYRLTPP